MRLVAAICFLFPAVSLGAVYQWTDKKGVLSFTDNLEKVPPAYRGSARIVDPESGSSHVTIIPASPAPAPAQTKAKAKPTPERSAAGGRDRDWWQARFAGIRNEIRTIENSLPEKRKELDLLHHRKTVFQRRSDKTKYNAVKTEIERDEGRLVELRAALQSLDEEAARSGVPTDWRR